MLTAEGGIIGIDLDNCRDPEMGSLEPWVADVIELGETYAEVSPSERGIRMFALADTGVASQVAHHAGVEVYASGGRYVTVTGNHLPGTPVMIAAAPRTLEMLQERVAAYPKPIQGDVPPAAEARTARDTPFSKVNSAALENLPAWVPTLLPAAREHGKGFRVSSADLGRDLQEDLSIMPNGIKDFGVHDMGDARGGRRTPVDLVLAHGADAEIEVAGPTGAAMWLCEQLDIDPGSLGFRSIVSAFDGVVEIPRTSNGANPAHADTSCDCPAPPASSRFKRVDIFCAEYRPLSYIVEPIVRTSSIYTLTAKTGGGKTGLAVIIALAVATGRGDILGMDVVHGCVAYCAFENPDDVRMRIMVAAFRLDINLAEIADRFVVLDARVKPEDLILELRVLSAAGEFALIIVDTFAAAFDGNDVNDNVQTGEFVRRLRPLTQMPGLPGVLVTAHPVKSASDDQLVPYGGGAILNEVDGNLALAKKADAGTTVLHWQGKFRGLEFAPLHFRFEIVASPTVVDIKGRQVELPVLRPSSPDDADRKAEAAAHRDIAVLRAVVADPKATVRAIERATGISRSAVTRQLAQLSGQKLIEKGLLERWQLTKKGVERLSKISGIDDQ